MRELDGLLQAFLRGRYQALAVAVVGHGGERLAVVLLGGLHAPLREMNVALAESYRQ